MPHLEEKHQEMLSIKHQKEAELQAHRGVLLQSPDGAETSAMKHEMSHSIVNVLSEVEVEIHEDAVEALKYELDGLHWNFMMTYVIPHVKNFSWAIPNDEAIAAIKKFGPIVEMGAGSGYWAYLLAQSGVDVVAYDNGSFNSHEEYKYNRQWFDVQKGDETAVLGLPHRTLMLCWPPKWNEMAANTLRNYHGNFVIYIGESAEQGTCGTPDFFESLGKDFDLIQTVKIPNWPGYKDQVYIYQRKI